MNPDLDLTPLTIGFDLRLHSIEVSLPSEARSVRYDLKGETKLIEGSTVVLTKALRKAGYKVKIAP
jgi:hypothetical protein